MTPDRSVPRVALHRRPREPAAHYEHHAQSYTLVSEITISQYRVDGTAGSVATTPVETLIFPRR